MSTLDDITLDDEDDLPTAPFWLTTYSDMVTLLLTFFVLIVSMSEVEVKKFQEALSYFHGHKSVLAFESMVPPVYPREQQEQILKEAAQRYDELLAFLQSSGLADKVEVELTERGLHVTITDSVVFASGSAVLLASSREVLAKISGVMGEAVASVEVEGHTDNLPIGTSVFPSNWELSAARAASVVRFFLEQENALDPGHYSAIGRGEFHPVASNDTAAGRSRNRRVEILFVSRYARID